MKSLLRTFSEFDAYEATIRAAQVTGYNISAKGDFHAELQQVDLGQLWMQRGHERLARSVHLNIPTSRSPIFFLDRPDQASVLQSGHEIAPGQLVFWSPEASHYQKTAAGVSWASMSLSPADLLKAGIALGDIELTAPKVTQIITPDPTAMAHLTGLHHAATRLAKEMPERLSHPEVERSMSQALIAAMIKCLRPPLPRI